jgi:hypothetical protein
MAVPPRATPNPFAPVTDEEWDALSTCLPSTGCRPGGFAPRPVAPPRDRPPPSPRPRPRRPGRPAVHAVCPKLTHGRRRARDGGA